MAAAGRVLAVLVASTALVLTSTAASAQTDDVGGRPFTVQLTGEAEVTAQGVPNQGDLDGTGTAHLRINPGKGLVCWEITVADVAPITAAHIHVAPSTSPGPVVVPLNPYTGGCTTVTREMAVALMRSPEAYYVNVHNADYPAGALRGQLDG